MGSLSGWQTSNSNMNLSGCGNSFGERLHLKKQNLYGVLPPSLSLLKMPVTFLHIPNHIYWSRAQFMNRTICQNDDGKTRKMYLYCSLFTLSADGWCDAPKKWCRSTVVLSESYFDCMFVYRINIQIYLFSSNQSDACRPPEPIAFRQSNLTKNRGITHPKKRCDDTHACIIIILSAHMTRCILRLSFHFFLGITHCWSPSNWIFIYSGALRHL